MTLMMGVECSELGLLIGCERIGWKDCFTKCWFSRFFQGAPKVNAKAAVVHIINGAIVYPFKCRMLKHTMLVFEFLYYQLNFCLLHKNFFLERGSNISLLVTFPAKLPDSNYHTFGTIIHNLQFDLSVPIYNVSLYLH